MNLRCNQPRKIISVGYSYLVSLPIIWLKHQEIGKGDFLDFEIDENKNLIIKNPKKNEH